MLPALIKPEHFSRYLPLARELATSNIELLRRLPLAYVSLLLREMIAYDWKFPVERHEIARDLKFLGGLPTAQFEREMAAFRSLKLTPELEAFDWVNSPAAFSEKLTAHLWATHQIDQFRSSAVAYMNHRNEATPDIVPPIPRLGIAVIGQGVRETKYPLFRKLRPHGVYFRQVNANNGLATLLIGVSSRANHHAEPFAHWYVDGGGRAMDHLPAGVTTVSYGALAPIRAELQRQMQKAYESGMGAEAMRSLLARMRPEDVGFDASKGDPVLNSFEATLLTEGSGTQVFATTFVQWAAREALRRAQPSTLLARFAPRQRERPMNELLEESKHKPDLDPHGSLIDADMGAYYTWLNQQRLSGVQPARFLAWFEDHTEAVAIGPGFDPGKVSNEPVELASLLTQLNT